MSKSQYYFDQRYLDSEDPWGIFSRPSQTYRLEGYLRVIDKYFSKGVGNVLEIACANGYFTKLLAKRAKSILAVDYSREMIDLAQKNNSFDFVRYQIGHLPLLYLGSDKFNLVTAFEVILYFSDEEKKTILLNIWKMLSVGGFFIFTENFKKIEGLIDRDKFKVREAVVNYANFLNLQDHVYNVARRLSFLIDFVLKCRRDPAYRNFGKKYRHKPVIAFFIYARPILLLMLPVFYLLNWLMRFFYSSKNIHSWLLFLSKKFNYRTDRQTIVIQKI